MTASPAAPGTAPACPVEAVFPSGRYPCTLPHGHALGHKFADEPVAEAPGDSAQDTATPGQAAMSREFAAELIAANDHLGRLVADLRAANDQILADSKLVADSLREQLLRTEEQCRRHVNKAEAEAARYKAERDEAVSSLAALKRVEASAERLHRDVCAERDRYRGELAEILRITWHFAGEHDRKRIAAIVRAALGEDGQP